MDKIMKKMMLAVIVCLFGLYCFCSVASAQTIYVTGVTKITMRTGPGLDNKILAMLTSGTELKMLNHQSDWSEVATKNGKVGWVLTRFLTEELPLSKVVTMLEKKNRQLTEDFEKLKNDHDAMIQENARLTRVEKEYQILAKNSANFLKLDADYKALSRESQDQKKTIESLEKSLKNDTKFWFLSGAGVFLVGVLLGLSTRPGKRNSLGV